MTTDTALDSTLMDEPTLAADLDKLDTQSIRAWSQADDAEALTEYIPRRSWKLPALIAALAATAAVGAGAFLMFPQESATKPQVAPAKPPVAAPTHPSIAPSPPVQQQSPDERFIALLKQRRVVVVSPLLAVNGAHETCTDLAQGWSARDIAEAATRSTPGTDLKTESTFVATAQEVYCPPTVK